MIYDKIENLSLYFDENSKFARVEPVLKDFLKAPFDNGKIEIDGDNMWCNVAKYNVEDNSPIKYESHKEYADVQIMVDGEENVGWATFSDCTITEDFKEGCDIAFMNAPNGQMLALRKGYFMVFFPDDAHAPCRKSENSDFAHKLVFKVKL